MAQGFALRSTAGGKVLTFGAGIAGKSFTPPATSDTLTLGIQKRSAEEVYPETIVFQVTDYSGAGFDGMTMNGNYNPALHLAHFWDFNDSYTYTAPTQNTTVASALSFTDFTNAGTSRAAQPAHTFRAAGTYSVTVSVWGFVSGVLTEATGTINVTVGTEAFATTRTIYVDPDGIYAGKPTGAQETTTLAGAAALLSGSTPQRVMLRTGVTHTITANATFNASGTLHFVSDTPGTAAVIDNNLSTETHGVTFNPSPTGDLVVQDIRMDGPINTLTHGYYDSGSNPVNGIDITNTYELCLFDRVQMYDHNIQIWNAGGTNSDSIYCINDSVVEGFWARLTDGFNSTIIAFTGSRLWHRVDAVSNAVAGIFTGEHMRHGTTTGTPPDGTVFIVDKCDIFGRTKLDGGAGRILLRFHTNGAADTRLYVMQNCIEGEGQMVTTGTVPGEPLENVPQGNHIFEGNIVTGCRNYAVVINMSFTGVTARNNIMVVTEYGTRDNTNLSAFWGFGNDSGLGWVSGALTTLVECYNNTCISFTTAASQFDGTLAEVCSFGDVDAGYQVEANNILYQPNLAGGSTADGPLDLTTLYTPLYKGVWTSSDGNSPSSPATGTAPLDDVCTGAPTTGAGAIGAATTGKVATHDFYGNNRKTIADSHSRSSSSGAIEPNLAS